MLSYRRETALQGALVLDQSKARMRLFDFVLVIVTDILSRTVSELSSLLFKFWTLCVFEPPWGGGAEGRRTIQLHISVN